jgi:cytoskeletal protein CcmA (bactofilin family)
MGRVREFLLGSLSGPCLGTLSPVRTEKEIALSAMWKPTQQGQSPSPTSTPEQPAARPVPVQQQPTIETPRAATSSVGEQASISKGLSIKGEITGTESLFIDGKVEGSISIPGNRVTVGKNGNVTASISAREIVVLGKLKGNVNATDRVDIRAEGALTGDVAAARISIEDGAFFKGGIDIRKPDSKAAATPAEHAKVAVHS